MATKMSESDPTLNSRENSNPTDTQLPPDQPHQEVASGSAPTLTQDPPVDPDACVTVLNKEALVLELESRRLLIEGSKPVLRTRLIRHLRELRGEIDRAQVLVDTMIREDNGQNRSVSPV